MSPRTYRYKFNANIAMQQVQEILMLATAAVEGLHGRSRINLDASYRLNEKERICEIEAGNEVGCAIARIFTGLLANGIGEGEFKIIRPVPEGVA